MRVLGIIFSWLLWFAAGYIVVAVIFRWTLLYNADNAWELAFKWTFLLLWMLFGNVQ